MADNDNKDLMQFLEKQFEGIYKRLDNTPTKDDLVGFATKDDFVSFATKDDFVSFATKDDLAGFATKDDLAGFATKDDLAGFATKDDLAGFATKDDLASFATKDDLISFATKDDLDSKITAAKEETMRHTGVLIEAVRHDIKIVIEGLMGSNEKRDRDKEEHEQEHARLEKITLINSADISTLDKRVGRLEERV